ncbi:3-hydroxyacyl-CoA dehydrogenase NAD-binding domain-containing protein [Desulfomonile tiedjei]|uniref:3-hydroxyacyl-CoA dehydrogenase n=1 Tax=Desulfomonile tiedjei (strain ATCC 49306 / DSM 6799 / DCB-1) TaxID=706587 RepID=I4C3Z8_DESTA|nr:3-hydroxyacyl-CoA dehydrogenase NAD-binding domain-containing protein [Desulfomonile tiedjei]AFM24289.1 3-hydroxyacyl-CoA dehydrogenase [Desulfomonile tiedjei DSM 6799]
MPEVAYHLDQATRVATFVIDTAGPVNTIGLQFITDLEKASARAQKDAVNGVVIVSAKKKSFLDGANLKEIITDATPQTARLTVRRYQDALADLAESPFPVVAALNNQSALGGGFELLLWACDHIFATPGSKMGLPEVSVGLFPAGGGTQTLKRVVGFKTAVDMITTARVVPVEALAASGAFTVCSPADLMQKATEWTATHSGAINRNYDPDYVEPDAPGLEEKQAILNSARFRYTISPYRPYLIAAIDALEAGLTLSFDDAVKKEVDLFVPLLFHENSRNKIDLFFLATSLGPKLARVDASKAVPVDRIAVIGAGLMGLGIAQIAADKGIRTLLIDVDETRVKAAVENLSETLEDLVIRGRWARARKDAVLSNISWTVDYSDLKGIPLIIECVFEDPDLKKRILAHVQAVNPDAIFASNTSTIPMAEISEGAIRPEQVVGMHFFSPVPLMPLLEVIQGKNSSQAAVATVVTVGRAIGKTVILMGDGPGFYTSRTFGTFVNNGIRLVELGVSPWDVDMLALQAGFPQGPLHIYGTAGGNVIYHAGNFLARKFKGRLELPESLGRLYEAGCTGAGKPCFYLDSKRMLRDESILQHIAYAEGFPLPSDEDVKDILLLGMVNEAFWCMSEGVLKDFYSMDLGAVLGIGFPDCWHGPARYVSLKGVSNVKARLEELSAKYLMPQLKPAPEFDRLIACGLETALI